MWAYKASNTGKHKNIVLGTMFCQVVCLSCDYNSGRKFYKQRKTAAQFQLSATVTVIRLDNIRELSFAIGLYSSTVTRCPSSYVHNAQHTVVSQHADRLLK